MKSDKIMVSGMDDRLLASVRDGALEFEELLANVRELVAEEAGREAVYDGAREQLLSEIRSEASSADRLRAIREALHRISSYARAKAPEATIDPLHVLAIRMDVLSHAISDQSAFSEAYTSDSLRHQPHVEACLSRLLGANGSLSREALLNYLGLKQSNGTRVLKLLEGARLVTRRKVGQTVTVLLTSLGRKAAMKWASPAPSEPSPPAPVIALREGRVQGMPNDNWSIRPRAYATAIQ
jgi:hypothetical protein